MNHPGPSATMSTPDPVPETTTRAATSAAVAASWFAWRAESALWRTVPVSCSMLAAVSCRVLAVCSVRALRSWLPRAISPLATSMPWLDWCT